MAKRIVIGITGASGVVYGVRMLERLRELGVETHLVISESGKKNIEIETGFTPAQVAALATHCYDSRDVGATLASGSFLTDGMAVVPCSIKTLSGIAHSYNENLLVRAADVTLKEKRRLVLVVRETPLHLGHLRMMQAVTECGALILPPIPAFYHQPKTLDDVIHQTIGKVMDALGIEHALFQRWEGAPCTR
jgi:4-hydroxy-3-polyprenylbenzoate decarboxylase